MKAQFKYAFLAGLFFRGPVFIVIFVMNTTFIILGSLGLLPPAAHITAVSLGGVAIAVMLAANIGGDIAVARRMFLAPEAYLHALTPVPRRKILLASILVMALMDIVSMAAVIFSEVWLSFNLAGGGLWQVVLDALAANPEHLTMGVWIILLGIAGYLLLLNVILFSVTAKKSFLFTMPASGLLAFLTACLCMYAASLLQLLLAPFGVLHRYGLLFIITLGGGAGLPLYILLTLAEAVALFIFSAKLLERKVNI